MSYKRILTVQDISCVGQCSLTVALPILSACGMETAILPSAVLSTHTAGFTGFTCADLSGEMPKIIAHWKKEGIKFDAVYTGYLGSTDQVDYILDISNNLLVEGAPVIIDPAMADNGKLYPAFDARYVEAMKKLASKADILLPNITEACLLVGEEYREEYDENYINGLFDKLTSMGAKSVVLTGVGYKKGTTGVAVCQDGTKQYYSHLKYEPGCHGTGDVYASAFVGAYMNGKEVYQSAVIAADYTLNCIEVTREDPDHWYGVEFEKTIPSLISKL